jgi:hypothetical protein
VPFFRPSAERRPDQFGELLCATPQPSMSWSSGRLGYDGAKQAASGRRYARPRSLFMSRRPASAIAPRSAASPRTSKPPRLRTSNWPCVDQGYTGERPAQATAGYIRLEVVKLPEAKGGFILLARRWTPDRVRGRGLLADCGRSAFAIGGHPSHAVEIAILRADQKVPSSMSA